MRFIFSIDSAPFILTSFPSILSVQQKQSFIALQVGYNISKSHLHTADGFYGYWIIYNVFFA